MASFEWPPSGGGGSGSGITTYTTFSAFPASAPDGSAAIALDTDTLYIFNSASSTWLPIGNPSTVSSIGTIDTGMASANGAHIVSNALILQSASATVPGLINNASQTISGQKTFSTGLTGTLTGSATLNVLTSALGTLTESTSSVLTLSGWTNATVGSPTITVKQASGSASGYLSSTDWTTFNSKQAAGNYITALTGDGSATGGGSATLTLATVNGNVGSFGTSTSIPSFTVNAKGLITAASGNAVIAPAGTLSGTVLNSTVVTSSLTSVGAITSGTWTGTTIAIASGGTGQTTALTAFTSLSTFPFTAGQSFTANTSYAIRLAIQANSETISTVYAADDNATSLNNFYFIGMGLSAAGVTAGGTINVTTAGIYTLGSADTAFTTAMIGQPVFLNSSGAFSTTPPSTSNLAITRIGIVFSTTKIFISPAIIGVN